MATERASVTRCSTSRSCVEVVALFQLYVDVGESVFAVVPKFHKVVVQAYSPNDEQHHNY